MLYNKRKSIALNTNKVYHGINKWLINYHFGKGKVLMENNLKVFRAKRNLSGNDVAKILGITTQSYYNLEKGSTDVKVKHIRMIAKEYGLSLEEVAETFNI